MTSTPSETSRARQSTILVIASDTCLARRVTALLESERGFAVTTVAGPADGPTGRESSEPDVVLVDIRAENVLDTVSHVRASYPTSHVVAVGTPPPRLTFELFSRGLDAYVPDPVEQELLFTLAALPRPRRHLVLDVGAGLPALDTARQQMIAIALASEDGCKASAARRLRIAPRVLRYWLERYGMK